MNFAFAYRESTVDGSHWPVLFLDVTALSISYLLLSFLVVFRSVCNSHSTFAH